MLVYGHDDELAEWLGAQLGISFAPPYVAIGVMRGVVVAKVTCTFGGS